MASHSSSRTPVAISPPFKIKTKSLIGIVLLLIPTAVFSWLPPLSTTSIGRTAAAAVAAAGAKTTTKTKTTLLFSSTVPEEEVEDDDDDDYEEVERTPEDYTGKTIYQRTFYRLSPDSQVQLPNAIMIEERLRFQPDTANPGYILPVGPRTLILREGSEG